MALKIRGIQPLNWGTQKATGYVTESTGADMTGTDAQIEDEDGEFITDISGIGIKEDLQIDVIPLSTIDPDTMARPGDTFTYGTAPDEESMIIRSRSRKRVKKDVEKWTFKGQRFANIDSAEPA